MEQERSHILLVREPAHALDDHAQQEIAGVAVRHCPSDLSAATIAPSAAEVRKIDLHVRDARTAGEDERRLATVAVWRDTPFFSDRERAALMWTESLTRVADTHVPDEAWEVFRTHFSDVEQVDLTLLINTINAWN